MSKLAFVSGANGFIAQHIVQQLLKAGYDVVGSVRSAAKGDALAKDLNTSKFKYEIVADIGAPDAFGEVFSKYEFDVVLHTATLFDMTVPQDKLEELTVKPAVEGTTSVLKSATKHSKSIKQVVITSSLGSMANFAAPTEVIDETSINPITREYGLGDAQSAYILAKTLADQAVWDYVKTEKPLYTVTSIHPSLVLGPQAFASSLNSPLNFSAEILTQLLKLKEGDEIPEVAFSFTDVRDVARAHVVALEKPGFDNQRVILTRTGFNSQYLLNAINKRLPDAGFVKGDPSTATTQGLLINDEKSRALLGFDYYDPEDTIGDAVQQAVEAKAV